MNSIVSGYDRSLVVMGLAMLMVVGVIASEIAEMKKLAWAFVAGQWICAAVLLENYRRNHA